jgi:fatty-acyl-CoA synthase
MSKLAGAAAEARASRGTTWESFFTRPAVETNLPEASPDDIAYLQYSSGSTRFPHGVAVTHRGLLNNLAAHSHGMEVVDSDRCVSWLPGIMTWGWSAACSPRSPTRSRPII